MDLHPPGSRRSAGERGIGKWRAPASQEAGALPRALFAPIHRFFTHSHQSCVIIGAMRREGARLRRRERPAGEKLLQFSWRDTLLTLLALALAIGLSALCRYFDPEGDSYAPMLFLFAVALISRLTRGYFLRRGRGGTERVRHQFRLYGTADVLQLQPRRLSADLSGAAGHGAAHQRHDHAAQAAGGAQLSRPSGGDARQPFARRVPRSAHAADLHLRRGFAPV